MDIYAALTRDHIQRFGTTPRQIAHVAAKNHFHSTMNPLSQFRKDFTVDEVLAARPIVWPLTLPMCSPISDGAAAAIVCTGSALKRFDAKRAVRVKASVLAAGRVRPVEAYDQHVCRLAAQRAYDEAGIGPKDISVAEVHDASAFAELLQSENLQFCAIGDGGPLAESGATRLGGRIPINPSGGLESKGHPIGATGLGQIYELATQVRGEAGARQVEGARFAIAENGGGIYGIEEATCCITVLGRD
jgi:acetyl-CoA acetyltransferase